MQNPLSVLVITEHLNSKIICSSLVGCQMRLRLMYIRFSPNSDIMYLGIELNIIVVLNHKK